MPGTNPEIGKKKKKHKKKDKNMLHLKTYIQKIGRQVFTNDKHSWRFEDETPPGAMTIPDATLTELNHLANYLVDKIGKQATSVQKNYTGGSTLNAPHIRAACGVLFPDMVEQACHMSATSAANAYDKFGSTAATVEASA
jgi:hypothetical protein